MALINCNECKKEISDKAATCPHCGAPVPKKKPNAKMAAIVWIIILGVGSIWLFSGKDPKPAAPAKVETPAAAPAVAKPKCAADNLQCLAEEGGISASVYCPRKIEKLASNAVKWTDGTFESKFSRMRWLDKEKGQITYIGDKAQFQNGFGAFINMIYECDLDKDNETVLAVRAEPGRLP